MQLVFSGINIVLMILIILIPAACGYYLFQRLKNKENNKDELVGRIIILENKVRDLEDYIESFIKNKIE